MTDFSHAEATPPVLHYRDLELDLAKALRSQVLKSKQCTHPRTISNREKGKTRITTKTHQKTKTASAKQKMPQIKWSALDPPRRFVFFGHFVLPGIHW
jgi:hypothetical protein